MRAHVIEIGPGVTRRLCCGTAAIADPESRRIAFECIDDRIALVDRRPVTVAALWAELLASIDCGTAGPVIVVYPSWWSAERVTLVDVAARVLAGVAELRPRTWLLARASAGPSVIVEIADSVVVVTGDTIVVESRRADADTVAKAVGHAAVAMAAGTADTVVIDAPATMNSAPMLAGAIAKSIRAECDVDVVLVDDLRIRRLAGELRAPESPDRRARWGRSRRFAPLTVTMLVAGVIAAVVAPRPDAGSRIDRSFSTALVVEGHVAVEVPADWVMRRVLTGPGSARVEVVSPTDPEAVLHLTQSRVALSGLDATAQFLKGAIDAGPAGVFVDFNPADRVAGRPVVTYREMRASHDIRWIVWVEKTTRISIGCQGAAARYDAVSQACELAVRSARIVD